MSELTDVIRRMVNSQIKPDVMLGQVKSFDSNQWTITVELNQGATVEDVTIRSVVNNEDTGIFIEPKVGSYVLCALTDGKLENLKVLLFSEIENLKLMPKTEIQLHGDQFEGLVKAPELKTQLDKMTQRIDKLYQAINAGTPATGAPDSGAALASSMKAVIAIPPPTEDFSNIKNDNVKHG